MSEIKKNMVEDYISDSAQTALDNKADADGGSLTNTTVNGVTLNSAGPGTNYLSDDGDYKPLASAPVDSVNGQTGVVVLDAGDINAVTDKNYVTDAEKTNIGNLDSTGPGTNYLSDDGTYKPVAGGTSSNLEIQNVAGGTINSLDGYRRGDPTLIDPTTEVTVLQNVGGTDSSDGWIGQGNTFYEVGQSIEATKTGNLFEISVWLKRFDAGTIDMPFDMEIFSDAGFTSLIGTSNESYNQNGLSETLTKTTFTFSGVEVTNTATYYFKINKTNTTVNSGDFIEIDYVNTNPYASGQQYRLDNVGTPTALSGLDVRFEFKIGDTEDRNKHYQSSASLETTSSVDGVALNSAVIDGNFDGAFEGIIDGFNFGIDIPYSGNSLQINQGTFNSASAPKATAIAGQTFTIDTEQVIDSIVIGNSDADAGTGFIRLYKSGVLVETSPTIDVTGAGDKTFAFTYNAVPGSDYEFRYVKASGDFQIRYSTTDQYTGGFMTENDGTLNVPTADLRFQINGTETLYRRVEDPVYLQDDGSLGLDPGTNEVSVGTIYSNTELEIASSGGGGGGGGFPAMAYGRLQGAGANARQSIRTGTGYVNSTDFTVNETGSGDNITCNFDGYIMIEVDNMFSNIDNDTNFYNQCRINTIPIGNEILASYNNDETDIWGSFPFHDKWTVAVSNGDYIEFYPQVAATLDDGKFHIQRIA